MDLEEMIQNLEGERQRIYEALEVLRRLHRVRKSGVAAAPLVDSRERRKIPIEKPDAGQEEK